MWRDPYPEFYVSGGVFVRLYNDLPMKDIDVFAKGTDNYQALLAYYRDYRKAIIISSNVCLTKLELNGTNIDLVNKKNNLQINSNVLNFDFTFLQLAATINPDDDRFTIQTYSDYAMDDLMSMRVRSTGNLLMGTPKNNTLNRFMKYARLGFDIEEGSYEYIAQRVQEKMLEGVGGILEGPTIGIGGGTDNYED